MAIYELVLPKMGESVSEATVTKWLKGIGDAVSEDESIVEVATDKVDSDVPSPVNGKIIAVFFKVDQVAQVGDVLAHIETEGGGSAQEEISIDVSAPINNPNDEDIVNNRGEDYIANDSIPGTELLEQQDEETQVIYSTNRFYSPLVKSIAQEEGLTQQELEGIRGTGADGRVTKEDVLNYIQNRTGAPVKQNVMSAAKRKPEETIVHVSTEAKEEVNKSGGDEIIEMDRMRRLIADHMVQSVKTSPHVASFVEADVTHVVNWRNRVKDAYKKREGENITFTPIFIEAVSKALKDFPMVNVSVDGYNIIKKKNINIGMAAALPTGNLIVPVIKNADQLSLVGLSKAVNDMANRARNNQLKPDDTQGGTFTFTNIGAFGNIMGVPIINQPQAAILAVGTIKKRPAVLETADGDVIAIRHMLYLSLSYDHRVIDGALGGTFLKRVADYLENWDVNREI